MAKKLLIDLDGVLNKYCGEYKEDYIPPILSGTKDFLEKVSKKYEVKIFSTRDKNLVQEWVFINNLDKYVSDITNIKEPAWAYLDDRCVFFNGNFDDAIYNIENLKPWWK